MRKLVLGLLIVAILPGCATFTAQTYSPDYEAMDQMKKIDIDKLSVGKVEPQDPNAEVNKITLRGAPLKAPDGTFATYLENAIRSDLQEMGVYDSAATTRIDATILKNDIDVSGISTGTGMMAVNLKISKQGSIALDQNYAANTQFDSSFMGAVAAPIGEAEYPKLVRALLQQVYADPAFIKAVSK